MVRGMQTTLAFVLAIASHIHDARGFQKPIPVPVAEAVVVVSNDSPLWENQERETAATLAYWAFRESSWLTNVIGDSGKSCGLGQTPCRETPHDAVGQLRIMVKHMKRSMLLDPEHPFRVYASGDIHSVAGARISDARSQAVRELLVLVEEN